MAQSDERRRFGGWNTAASRNVSRQQLDAQATAMSDNDSAQRLNDARATSFKTVSNRSKTAV